LFFVSVFCIMAATSLYRHHKITWFDLVLSRK
jgi:hypothetical protein